MQIYKYEAISSNGSKTSGSLLASDESAAYDALKKKKCHPTVIKKIYFASKKVSQEDLLLFFFHLDLQLKCKITITKAIESFVEFHGNKVLRASLMGVLDTLQDGGSLGKTFEKFSSLFDPVITGLLKSAEKTGEISVSISNILKFLELQSNWKRHVRQAISYPIFVAIIAILVLFLSIEVLGPQIMSLVQSFGNGNIPALTTFVIALLPRLSRIIFIFPFLAAPLLLALSLHKKYRRFLENMVIKIPCIGPVIIKSNIWQFYKILQIALDAKLNFMAALDLSISTIKLEYIKNELITAKSQIADGYGIAKSFSLMHIFSPDTVTAINVGEDSNDLAAAFRHISDAKYGEIIAEIQSIGRRLSVGLTLFTGLIFVLILCGLFYPIYNYIEIVGF
ncbi:MAG: type II secretion system F family protein [Holosporaceae bacterium]|nr:type II secretion system F family protein [Holosporaceae bacterium]